MVDCIDKWASDVEVGRGVVLVKQNLVFAATVIGVLVAFDLFGRLPLPLAVAGHEGSTAIVALNGLRLLSRRSWRSPIEAA